MPDVPIRASVACHPTLGMPAEPFATSLAGWHEFYAAVAEATAALLGLLFVGVSIRLSAMSAGERPEQRVRAGLAFGNLIAALVVAFIMLIPESDARSIALQIGLVAVLSIVRLTRRAADLRAVWSRMARRWASARRLAWAVIAVAMLAYAAIGLWTDGSAGYLYALLASVFIFLIGAADVAWDLLTHDEPTG